MFKLEFSLAVNNSISRPIVNGEKCTVNTEHHFLQQANKQRHEKKLSVTLHSKGSTLWTKVLVCGIYSSFGFGNVWCKYRLCSVSTTPVVCYCECEIDGW